MTTTALVMREFRGTRLILIIPDDLDDLGVIFFDFVVESRIIQAGVVGFKRVLLLFSRFGISQRGELDLVALSHFHLALRHRSPCGSRAKSRSHGSNLEARAAFRASDWRVVEVVKFCTAMSAQALRPKFLLSH